VCKKLTREERWVGTSVYSLISKHLENRKQYIYNSKTGIAFITTILLQILQHKEINSAALIYELVLYMQQP